MTTQIEQIEWHKYPDEKPEDVGQSTNYPSYLVVVNGIVIIYQYNIAQDKWQIGDKYVTAWAVLPKGWKE